MYYTAERETEGSGGDYTGDTGTIELLFLVFLLKSGVCLLVFPLQKPFLKYEKNSSRED